MLEKNAEGLFEKAIHGHTVCFSKWGTTQSALFLLEFLKLCHKAMGQAAGIAFTHDIDKDEVTSDMVSLAVTQLLDGLSRDPQRTLALIQKLVTSGVQLDGRRVNFEKDFEGNFELLIDMCAAAFEVQYENFSFVWALIQRYQGIGMTAPSQIASPS